MGHELRIVTRGGHPDFLDLPWATSLEDWDHPRIVRMAHGVSRHVVRFVRYDDRVYALKATDPHAAGAEHRVLRGLRAIDLPVVEPVGVVDRSGDLSVLITRYLDFSLPYSYLIGREDGPGLTHRLLDAAAVLLVRLHLDGVFWGDCSLSNILFRRDAGAMMAYLVDAETTEQRDELSDGLRDQDLEVAWENVAGGLMDLQASGRIPGTLDPATVADDLRRRYTQLWEELTSTEEFDDIERWRIDHRVRRVNDLGFDVEELAITRTGDGRKLRLRPVLVEEGHHSRELRDRTGLSVQENQARRLLADIASFGARLEHDSARPIPNAVAAARWLAEVYEPIVAAIPSDLKGRLEPAEFFHQLLEHRYFMSERAHREISNAEALDDYLANVLPERPAEQQLLDE